MAGHPRGLSGYPEPWLPVGERSAWWLLALTAASQALVLPALWRLNGGDRLLPASRPLQRLALWGLLLLAVLVPWLPAQPGLGGAGPAAVLPAGLWPGAGSRGVARLRGDRWAQAGLAALAPMLVLILADACRAGWLLEYRVEALQLAVTWLLMMAAYALNQRLGRLRQQRDELRQLAETDGLTGLPNRRAGLQQLAQHLERVDRERGPLVIGFLIDLFRTSMTATATPWATRCWWRWRVRCGPRSAARTRWCGWAARNSCC